MAWLAGCAGLCGWQGRPGSGTQQAAPLAGLCRVLRSTMGSAAAAVRCRMRAPQLASHTALGVCTLLLVCAAAPTPRAYMLKLLCVVCVLRVRVCGPLASERPPPPPPCFQMCVYCALLARWMAVGCSQRRHSSLTAPAGCVWHCKGRGGGVPGGSRPVALAAALRTPPAPPRTRKDLACMPSQGRHCSVFA